MVPIPVIQADLSRRCPSDLPSSEWSIDYFSLNPEGEDKWARDTGLKLREAEIILTQGRTTGDACRRIAVSEQTYYRWRKEFGGLKTDQARRMKDLLLLEFYSGATRLSGRFSEGLLLRRFHFHSLHNVLGQCLCETRFQYRTEDRKNKNAHAKLGESIMKKSMQFVFACRGMASVSGSPWPAPQ